MATGIFRGECRTDVLSGKVNPSMKLAVANMAYSDVPNSKTFRVRIAMLQPAKRTWKTL